MVFQTVISFRSVYPVTQVSVLIDLLRHWLEAGALDSGHHAWAADLILELQHRSKRLIRRCQRQGQASVTAWLGVVLVLLVLWLWNWILVLALVIGVSMAMGCTRWLRPWRGSRQSWTELGIFAPIPLALTSGALAALGTYGFLAIWRDTGSVGLAVAAMLPELSVLAVLGLLLGSQPNPQVRGKSQQVDRAVADLVALNPLKRLIAVRQLTQWAQAQQLSLQQQRDVADYLQVLLQQEPEPLVRKAVREGMEHLQGPMLPDLATRAYRGRSRSSIRLQTQASVLHPTVVSS